MSESSEKNQPIEHPSDSLHTQVKKMARTAIHALEEKKAEDIRVIDISQVSVIADYFIIANGNNRNQIQTLSDEVEETLGRAGYPLKQKEGYHNANWVLLDFGDIIIHILDKEKRIFYDLDRLWFDGKTIDIEELKK